RRCHYDGADWTRARRSSRPGRVYSWLAPPGRGGPRWEVLWPPWRLPVSRPDAAFALLPDILPLAHAAPGWRRDARCGRGEEKGTAHTVSDAAFAKYHALGNDYLVLDPQMSPFALPLEPPEGMRALCERLCDRHLGIGADGVVVGPLFDASGQ